MTYIKHELGHVQCGQFRGVDEGSVFEVILDKIKIPELYQRHGLEKSVEHFYSFIGCIREIPVKTVTMFSLHIND
jgi:hypothetical protein